MEFTLQLKGPGVWLVKSSNFLPVIDPPTLQEILAQMN